MDKAFNDNIRPLLDLADKLTPLLKGTKIRLPRIASCGMQSHGKSSTLESITHISLPKGDGTVTICPIKISLRNSEKEYARIKFECDSENNYEIIQLNQISDKIIEYQNKVKEINSCEKNEIKLFDEVIQVEVNRKNAPNLTLYDLPGLNFNENLKEQSEEINEKYLKEEETTVLLVISGSEEVHNSYAIEWMKKIPNYQKRFNPIITKADYLKDKNIGVYLDQINSLGLENNPSLIINRAGSNSNLSYDEMAKLEIDMINEIKNINQYPNIYKGIGELINHLIEIQKKDLAIAFSDLMTRINEEIYINEDAINRLPKECREQRDFFMMLEECVKNFSRILKKKMESLLCEGGKPKENLMKYYINLKFKEHIEKTKNKISELFKESFCNEVTNNIIQFSIDNISILEDNIPFNTLIRQKIINLFIYFEPTISDIYDYMISQIIPLIDSAFGYYQNLKFKVEKLFRDYANEQRKKVHNIYRELYYLETENVLTYNNDLINKVNCLNKHINFNLLGKKRKRDIEEENDNQNVTEEESSKFGIKKIINLGEDLVNDFGENVKNIFEGRSKLINSLIENLDNFENENKSRFFDNNEFTGRIKIAYRPQDIATYDEKIINPDYEKFYDEKKYEFIPGFQYIDKKELDEFKKLIKNGKIPLKTANVITKMVTYIEVMLNRVLDTFFLTIKKYLYDKLTDEDMINHIKNEIHLLNFDECRYLMEISREITTKRIQYKENLKKFKEAKQMISTLNTNESYNFINCSIFN